MSDGRPVNARPKPRFTFLRGGKRCISCGEPGARVVVIGGYAHKRCRPQPLPNARRR